MRFSKPRFSAIICSLFVGSVLFAQTDTGRIIGTVVDQTGAVVAGAKVSLKNERTGEQRDVVSNESGLYFATNLHPASYTVTADVPGFAKAEYVNIHLAVGQERTLAIVLQPAGVTSEVTVSAGELTVIDTSSATIGANVNEREVAQLPLNGRQVSQLYLLAPGAQTAGSGSFDNIRFSGRANQQNEIRIDGVEATSILDASPGNLNGEISSGFRLQSSLETIQEFRVESSNYPAEFGTGTGGQISVVTKSGSNAYHGSLFEYLRNSALDARNFFDGPDVSPLRLNQFGGIFRRRHRQEQSVLLRRLRGTAPASGCQSDRHCSQRRRSRPRSSVDRGGRERVPCGYSSLRQTPTLMLPG